MFSEVSARKPKARTVGSFNFQIIFNHQGLIDLLNEVKFYVRKYVKVNLLGWG